MEAGHGGHTEFFVITEFPVDLIADEEQVVLLGDVCDHPHFLSVQNNAGGVARIGDENGPGILGNQAFDSLPLGIAVALPGIRGQGPDDTACSMDKGGVVGVIGLRNDDLRIGVENAQTGQKQCLATAGGNEDIPGLQVNAQSGIVILYSPDELRISGRGIVGQRLGIVFPHRLKIGAGGCNVRLANVQMVDFLSPLLGSHGQRMELPHG